MNGLSRTHVLKKEQNNGNASQQLSPFVRTRSHVWKWPGTAYPLLLLLLFMLFVGQAFAKDGPFIQSQTDTVPPITTKPIANIMGYVGDESITINLLDYFEKADKEDILFELALNSFPEVASANINNHLISIDLLSPGQSNLIIQATYQDTEAELSFVLGAKPVFNGDYERVNFSDLDLEPDSFWNGADESGGFESGSVIFPNDYNPEWGAWSGWAYSNISDNVTPGWLNQYSAITGTAVKSSEDHPGVYAVGYAAWRGTTMAFKNDASHEIKGVLVTNATYTALSMLHGDDFSKKFGGESGDDPDWLKLSIIGMRNGEESGTVDYYLADYRFEDNNKNYVIQTWQWVELSSLGRVDSIVYELSSSDVGDWGMNTPAFFALGEVLVVPDSPSPVMNFPDNMTVNVYPNPTAGMVQVVHPGRENAVITVWNSVGQLAYRNQIVPGTTTFDLTDLPRGVYLIKVANNEESGTTRIIKQ